MPSAGLAPLPAAQWLDAGVRSLESAQAQGAALRVAYMHPASWDSTLLGPLGNISGGLLDVVRRLDGIAVDRGLQATGFYVQYGPLWSALTAAGAEPDAEARERALNRIVQMLLLQQDRLALEKQGDRTSP